MVVRLGMHGVGATAAELRGDVAAWAAVVGARARWRRAGGGGGG